MNEALYIAASGMTSVQRMLDGATHNTVNAETPGYQKHQIVLKNFGAVLDQADARQGLVTADEVIAFEQGEFRTASNPLAIALQGDGFLVVRPPGPSAEVAYTRNGDFALNANGELITRAGYHVLSAEEKPITLSAVEGPVTINKDGTIMQGAEEKGVLQVVDFPPEIRDTLVPVGETLFRTTDTYRPTLTDGATTVEQGFLEYPKAAGVKGLINMLMANKNYEAMQKAIRSIDSVNENLLRNTQ